MARSVFFPFIVEAAEIFVQFEAKVFKKIKGTFHKNKTECRNFETACRKVLMFFCVRLGGWGGGGLWSRNFVKKTVESLHEVSLKVCAKFHEVSRKLSTNFFQLRSFLSEKSKIIFGNFQRFS